MSPCSLLDVKQTRTKGTDSVDYPGVCVILHRCEGGTDQEVFET